LLTNSQRIFVSIFAKKCAELAAEAEKHQQTQTTTNQDPDPTTKLTTDGATISASSSDEGVGSLGGSASPEQAPGDAAAEGIVSSRSFFLSFCCELSQMMQLLLPSNA